MSKRANGEGNIRKRPDGTWEARYTFDGKRHSVYGKTQAEVRKKLTEAQAQIDGGAYIAPSKITVAEWLNKWQAECLSSLKQSTRTRYEKDIRLYIIPAIGKVKLNALRPDMIRAMNRKEFERGLSEKSIMNFNGTLHTALQQAVDDKLIQSNVCDNVKPPRANKPKAEMHPLKDNQVGQFIQAIRGKTYEALFYTVLFTGMRESEAIGLSWDCIDFQSGTVHLYRQLKREEKKGGEYLFTTLKNRQERTFKPPLEVISILKNVKRQQAEQRLKCGECWKDTGLVFTQEDGSHIYARTVYNNFKSIVREIGLPEVRFHDLRHTYATLALQNGMDYKTLSNNLGHATVAFTMDKYGHVSEAMMQDGADKMQRFIESL